MIISLSTAKQYCKLGKPVYAIFPNVFNGFEAKMRVTKIGTKYISNIFGKKCDISINDVTSWES